MKRAVSAFVLASALAPQLAADARFQPEPPFTLAHGAEAYSGVHVVADGRGGYVVAWSDYATETILAQHFDARGVPRAEPFVVQTPKPPYTSIWAGNVVADREGRFVITYGQSAPSPDGDESINFCLFGADDTRLLCDEVSGHRECEWVEAVASVFGPTGMFLLGWGEYDVAWNYHMFARVYDRDGRPRGQAFEVGPGDMSAYGPFVTHAGPDAFRIAWEDGDAAGWHIRAQRYDTWGAALEDPVEVLAAPACGDDAGNFVSIWAGLDAQEMQGVFARLYDAAGRARSAILQVNQATHQASPLYAACDAAGDFLVTWATWTNDQVFARRYAASGLPDSPEFRVDNGVPTYNSPLVAVTSERNGNFTVFLNGPEWDSPDIAQPYRVQPTPRVKGDFDDDGHADLVLRRADDGSVRVWCLHEGVRTANMPLWPTSPDPDWQIEGVADFNTDGHADLLVRQPFTGDVRVWLMGGASGVEVLGQAMLTGAPLPGPSWQIAATADFDRDGHADLLWRDNATQQLVVWLLDGTAWRTTTVPDPDHAVDANWKVVAAGDMNGDGWSDLLWYNTSSGRVVQWLLDATLTRTTGRFTQPAQAGDANWQVVAAADYGFGVRAQAGTYDILWRNATTGNLVAWFMDNAGQRTAGTFLTPSAPSDPLAWTVVGPR